MIALIWTLLMIAVLVTAVAGSRRANDRGPRPFRTTGAHYRRCYSRRGFLRLGLATGAAAVLAHTPVDESVDDAYATDIRSPATDRLSDVFRPGGERFWFFYWAAFLGVDAASGSTALTRWGRSAFEAMIVGLPVLWTLQRVAGASRPSDGPATSRWSPMADDNTASGHTFMAAIPWLVAARRAGGAPARLAAYLASLPTGWSRLNDRRHYLSQVGLGYAIAWQAVDAVDGVTGPGSGNA